jgi:hypothetical protein
MGLLEDGFVMPVFNSYAVGGAFIPKIGFPIVPGNKTAPDSVNSEVAALFLLGE